MARPPRDTRAGTFHIFTHCVWAAPALFRDDLDRTVFLRELVRSIRTFEWTCIAFCLMRTHYHLVLDVADGAMPIGMQSLNYRYAVNFNHRHGMRGHVQFGRYGAVRIVDDAHLQTAYRYVVRNPVEARLCAAPGDWSWSSYAGTVGIAEADSFVDAHQVLSVFGAPDELAVAGLRAYVEVS